MWSNIRNVSVVLYHSPTQRDRSLPTCTHACTLKALDRQKPNKLDLAWFNPATEHSRRHSRRSRRPRISSSCGQAQESKLSARHLIPDLARSNRRHLVAFGSGDYVSGRLWFAWPEESDTKTRSATLECYKSLWWYHWQASKHFNHVFLSVHARPGNDFIIH